MAEIETMLNKTRLRKSSRNVRAKQIAVMQLANVGGGGPANEAQAALDRSSPVPEDVIDLTEDDDSDHEIDEEEEEE